MNRKMVSLFWVVTLMSIVSLLVSGIASASTRTGHELRNLVAPIALYPDPILAILLPASTYVDQVIDADRKDIGESESAIERQDWDISVKALAHYPRLMHKMAQDPDWTAALGQAYVEQPQDLMDAVQIMRQRARANGVLRSTREQRVYLDGEYVRIVPAQPDLIYVPEYNPEVVYVERRPNYSQNLLAFGLGLLIGSWLSNDCDWHHHDVYNHGWRGGGWIANSRSHIRINNFYIVNRDRPVRVNHDILRRSVDQRRVRDYTSSPMITRRSNAQVTSHGSRRRAMMPRSVRRPDVTQSAKRRYNADKGPSRITSRFAAKTSLHSQRRSSTTLPNPSYRPKSHGSSSKIAGQHTMSWSGSSDKLHGSKMSSKWDRSASKGKDQRTKSDKKDKHQRR